MVKEILFPKNLKPEESVPVILEGIIGGTAAGLGMMTIGAFFSPEVSAALVSASAVATGFATTYVLQEKARNKEIEKLKQKQQSRKR
jgi:hypothetical protein